MYRILHDKTTKNKSKWLSMDYTGQYFLEVNKKGKYTYRYFKSYTMAYLWFVFS